MVEDGTVHTQWMVRDEARESVLAELVAKDRQEAFASRHGETYSRGT